MSECVGEGCDHSSHKENKEAVQEAQHSPMELKVAESITNFYLPGFLTIVEDLPGKACKRLLKRLVSNTLVDDNSTDPTTKAEENAYMIGDRLLTSKYLLTVTTLMQDPQFLKQTEEQINNENKEGEINGKV